MRPSISQRGPFSIAGFRLALRISNAFGMEPLLPRIKRGLAESFGARRNRFRRALSFFFLQESHDALSHHGIGHLEEAGDVGAHDVVGRLVAVFCGGFGSASAKMPFMMPLSFSSTSSNVQLQAHGSSGSSPEPEVATPPALAALPGAKSTPSSARTARWPPGWRACWRLRPRR